MPRKLNSYVATDAHKPCDIAQCRCGSQPITSQVRLAEMMDFVVDITGSHYANILTSPPGLNLIAASFFQVSRFTKYNLIPRVVDKDA